MTDKPTFEIDGRKIGADYPPYVIAEMSGNHNGDIGRALELIDAAKAAGADAVKLQTYTADTITIDSDLEDFQIVSGPWAGRSLYSLYEEASTPWEWHAALFARAREIGISIFSSPFDASAVEFLEALDCPAYKIASFEACDIALVERAAATGKPVIISTGASYLDEIEEAVTTAKTGGCQDIVVLHCVSSYPAEPSTMNLRTIPFMQASTNAIVGLSDHTLGHHIAAASIALGACVIEKHFTLRRADGGPDSTFSLEQDELAVFVQECREAWEALGGVRFDVEKTLPSVSRRRSLYVVADVRAGETLTDENVRSIRPGLGLKPKHLRDVLGRIAGRDLARGTALDWHMFK